MKKTVLLPVLLLAFSVSMYAQTDKGWRSVGGTGRLQLDFKNKGYYFNLSPEMYWFVGNNFALGLDFGVGMFSQKTQVNDSTTVKTRQFSAYAAPGLRYYFSDTEHKWRPYVFGNGGYEFYATHINTNGADSNNSSGGFRGYAGLGLGWFFSEHAAFDTRVHLVDYTQNDIAFNPYFSIGIQAFFHHE